MSIYTIQDTTLTDIADAIRSKTGKAASMTPLEMPDEIESISGGGVTPTGTKEITANGTNIDVASYAYADVAVPNSYAAGDEGKVVSNGALVSQSSSSATTNGTVNTTLINSLTVAVPASAVDSGTKSITANGSNQDVVGYAAVDVAVPNSYSQSDEGKVVSNGALVAQSSDSVTQNGTVDTTLINSLTVNVSGGGSSGLVYETGTYTAASDGNPTISFANTHSAAPAIIVFMDVSTSYIGTTAGTQYGFFDYVKLFGTKLKTGSTIERDGAYQWARVGTSGSTTLSAAILADTTTQVTSSGFTPNFNNNSKCKSGQTYKWIAIWK